MSEHLLLLLLAAESGYSIDAEKVKQLLDRYQYQLESGKHIFLTTFPAETEIGELIRQVMKE